MNKIAYLQGYLWKKAVWTGYTAETGATTATDKRENLDEKYGAGEEIENDGTPPAMKDYEGGGDAAVSGLPKGALEKEAIKIDINKMRDKETASKFPGFTKKDIQKAPTTDIGVGGKNMGHVTKNKINIPPVSTNSSAGIGTRQELASKLGGTQFSNTPRLSNYGSSVTGTLKGGVVNAK